MVSFSQKLADRKSGCFLVHCVHDANEKCVLSAASLTDESSQSIMNITVDMTKQDLSQVFFLRICFKVCNLFVSFDSERFRRSNLSLFCLSGEILFTSQTEQVGRVKCPNADVGLDIKAIYYVNMFVYDCIWKKKTCISK